MKLKYKLLKQVSLVLMAVGLVAFGIGFIANHHSDEEAYIEKKMEESPHLFGGKETAHAEAAHDSGHDHHMHHLVNQLHNRPWTAVLIVTFMFTGISAAALFFLCIQNVAQAGWSVVVFRVMEGIASFLPVGAILLFIVFLASYFGANHLYHWMDPALTDLNGDYYDKFIDSKSYIWLDKNWWIARAALYLSLWTLFSFRIKKLTAKLDETGSKEDYWKLYKNSVFFIVIFAVTSAAAAFDWIMSLDPHWYSTLFMWYNMVSYLVCAISIMILISLYLKSKKDLKLFNDNHQHDLTKYMFGFSMLWTYLFFAQFLLIWYANIPEEAAYFWARYDMYKPTYFWMLIPNFVMPLLILVSSDVKRVRPIVIVMAFVIVFGHFWDFFNQVTPATVGPFWSFLGLYETGALLFMVGAFIFIVFRAISKLKSLAPKGHPMFNESKIYEYPF